MSKKIIILIVIILLLTLLAGGGVLGWWNWDTIQRINPFGASIIQPPTVSTLKMAETKYLENVAKQEIKQRKKQLEEMILVQTKEMQEMEKRINSLTNKVDVLTKEIEKHRTQKTTREEIKQEDKKDDKEDIKKDTLCLKNSIDINRASKQELEKITGIASARAAQIIAMRPFCSLDGLMDIQGIATSTLEKIKNEGCAFVDIKNVKECEIKQEDKKEDIKKDVKIKDADCLPSSIDINSASKEELEKIDEIGPSRAAQIIEMRKTRPFSSLDDLTRVSGIATTTLQRIKDQGCAFVEVVRSGGGGSGIITMSQSSVTTPSQAIPTTEIKCLKNSIDINTASKEELDKIIRIGLDRAGQIIAMRPFCSLDDLIRVSGIATTTLQKIKDEECAYVTLEKIKGCEKKNEANKQNEQQEEKQQEIVFSLPAPTNSLLNEFFEKWEKNNTKPTHWTGSHSFNTNWFQNTDALVGNYSVRVGALAQRTLSQTNLTVEATTYTVVVYLKGGGQARVAILMGATGHTNYGSWISINETEWTRVIHTRSISAGNQGGIRIQTENSANILIGAAWLGTVEPPENWLQ